MLETMTYIKIHRHFEKNHVNALYLQRGIIIEPVGLAVACATRGFILLAPPGPSVGHNDVRVGERHPGWGPDSGPDCELRKYTSTKT